MDHHLDGARCDVVCLDDFFSQPYLIVKSVWEMKETSGDIRHVTHVQEVLTTSASSYHSFNWAKI